MAINIANMKISFQPKYMKDPICLNMKNLLKQETTSLFSNNYYIKYGIKGPFIENIERKINKKIEEVLFCLRTVGSKNGYLEKKDFKFIQDNASVIEKIIKILQVNGFKETQKTILELYDQSVESYLSFIAVKYNVQIFLKSMSVQQRLNRMKMFRE